MPAPLSGRTGETSKDVYRPIRRFRSWRCCSNWRQARVCAGSALRVQRCAEAGDEAFLAVGFAQIANRTGTEHALAGPLVRERRDENDRHLVAVGKQPPLQFGAAQAGHLDVRYHAGGLPELLGSEKLVGGGKGSSGITKRAQELLGGLAHGRVVVDN